MTGFLVAFVVVMSAEWTSHCRVSSAVSFVPLRQAAPLVAFAGHRVAHAAFLRGKDLVAVGDRRRTLGEYGRREHRETKNKWCNHPHGEFLHRTKAHERRERTTDRAARRAAHRNATTIANRSEPGLFTFEHAARARRTSSLQGSRRRARRATSPCRAAGPGA